MNGAVGPVVVASEIDVVASLNLEQIQVLEPPKVAVELVATSIKMRVFFLSTSRHRKLYYIYKLINLF